MRCEDREVDWFVLRRGACERLAPDGGTLRSVTFPGPWLDVEGLLAGDDPAMRAVLLAGVGTPERAAFCAALAQRGDRTRARSGSWHPGRD